MIKSAHGYIILRSNACIMNTLYKNISQRIQKTFEDNFSSLKPYLQQHYSLRLWPITGKKKYLSTIIKIQKQNLKEWLEDVKNLENENYLSSRGLQLVKKLGPYKGQRRKHQAAYYLKNSKIKFLTYFIWQTNKLKVFNLNGNLAPFFKKAVDFLKTYDWKNIYLNNTFLKVDPSECINSLFMLKNLGIVDLTGKIRKGLEKNFLPLKNLKEYQCQLLLYALAHIIINASNYYQNFVKPQKYHWILAYFTKNLKLIFKKATADIIAEIGLCFKLCHANKKIIRKTQAFIADHFDPKKNLIPKENSQSLNELEHRNTLAIMLLIDFKKLYPGPDLSKYF